MHIDASKGEIVKKDQRIIKKVKTFCNRRKSNLSSRQSFMNLSYQLNMNKYLL